MDHIEYRDGLPITIVRKGTQRVTRARRDALTARAALAERAAESLPIGEPTRPIAAVLTDDAGETRRTIRTTVHAWQDASAAAVLADAYAEAAEDAATAEDAAYYGMRAEAYGMQAAQNGRTTVHNPMVADDVSTADGLYLAAERAVQRYVRRWGMPRNPDVAEEAAQSAVVATLYGSGDPEADARAAELPGDRARVAWFAARAYRAALRTTSGTGADALSLDMLTEAGDYAVATLAADSTLAESMLDGRDACKADIACGVHSYRNGGPGHTEHCADCAALWNGALASVAVRTTVRGTTRKATQGRKADDSIAARILAAEADGSLSGAMRAAALGMSHAAYRKAKSRLLARAAVA